MSHFTTRKPTGEPVFPDLNIRVNGQPANTERLAPTHVTIPTTAILGFLAAAAILGVGLGYFALVDAYATLGGPGTREGTILTIAIAVATVAVVSVIAYTITITRSIAKARNTPDISDAACARRWRQHNADAKAAGCKCGRPATHAQLIVGTVGGVPAEIWSCEDHINVNTWTRLPGGHWTPAEYLTDMS